MKKDKLLVLTKKLFGGELIKVIIMNTNTKIIFGPIPLSFYSIRVTSTDTCIYSKKKETTVER